jgi:phosphotransferase system enzyme I (PtsI)
VYDVVLKGIPICRGIAIGRPLFLSNTGNQISRLLLEAECVKKEIIRYRNALDLCREDIKHLQQELHQEGIKEGAAILEAHLQIMHDPLLTTSVEMEIESSKRNSEVVLHFLLEKYQKKFSSLKNPFFRERFKDIKDIIQRILRHLHTPEVSCTHTPSNAIIFSRELTVAETAEAHIARAKAFVTESGSATSHAAIVARAKGTPYVSNISWTQLALYAHDLAIVDGRTGEIIFNPSHETLQRYEQMCQQLQLHIQRLSEVESLPSVTEDGTSIRLSANVEIAEELKMLHQYKGHGVGLYRSEYMCLSKDRFPSEQEQYETYSAFIKQMHGLPFVIRTFDIGGDKTFPGQYMGQELNPLGCRAIRFLLKEKSIFKSQLRAILRASAGREINILFPMISTLNELREAKEILKEAQQELKQHSIEQGSVRVGCMIEVPSAAIIVDFLAQECDFLSIGTNDLIQHVLVIDRTGDVCHKIHTSSHPSIIRLLKTIVQGATAANIPVSICGEIAADPRFTKLLVGLGIREISVSTRYIPTVRHALRNIHVEDAEHLAKKALTLKTSAEIQELIVNEYKRKVPEDCFYNY